MDTIVWLEDIYDLRGYSKVYVISKVLFKNFLESSSSNRKVFNNAGLNSYYNYIFLLDTEEPQDPLNVYVDEKYFRERCCVNNSPEYKFISRFYI